ncbi:MAG TPA: hypothetical protein VFU23_11600, partial [Gemmatimonadales bacterium]|nr:hypothetical protein [Gemmatimonadales bacterium]
LRAPGPRDRGRAGLMGRAITETGRPAGQVYVRAEWSRIEGAGAVRHDQMAIATDAGLWSFCDLPPGAAIALRVGARRGADPSATVELAEGRFPWLTLVAREADVGTVAATDSGQRLPELKTTGRIPVPASERFLTELRERMRRNGAPASALISRAELEKSNTFRLANVLLIHGLKSRVNKNGKQTLTCPHRAERPAVYVDGLLVDGSDSPNAKRFRVGLLSEMFDMENLSLDEVEAVEVYRSPAEWPPEFGRTEAPCVVVIWTRRGVKP